MTTVNTPIIAFNRPYLTGKEAHYLYQAVLSQKLSGNGEFTRRCHDFFEKRYGFGKCLLTTSCTDALEMCALLAGIGPGDEVIVPSFTFVSTANAFLLRGANIVFADSRPDQPNIDETAVEALVTPRTRAIVCVHYAGVACQMDALSDIARRHNLLLIEDAAQAVDSYFNGKPLGGIGQLAAFSFHETKNIHSGEGGMLAVNDPSFFSKSEIIWEKGTNRSAFFRGEVDKYNWVEMGSSFLPSEITAAFLWAQLENLDLIQKRRLQIWENYRAGLADLETSGDLRLPAIPGFATNNAHLFYVLTHGAAVRERLLTRLKAAGINAVFHYLSLHASPFFRKKHDGRSLPWSDFYTENLVRLPFFFEMTDEQQGRVIEELRAFFR